MSAGLFALLDDVAAMAKVAAASVDDVGLAAGRASTKAAGVVVDDTAVTPRFLEGAGAERELPIIRKIALGSLVNKLVVLLPATLLLSHLLPWAIPVLLILGGTYLAYEGAEKIWEKVSGHGGQAEEELEEQGEFTPEHEKKTVRGAIRTDFILSAEIMVIALNQVVSETSKIWEQVLVLVVVAFLITLLVYGVVALIVKMDDVGMHLAKKDSERSQRLGKALVAGMPKVLTVISVVGVAAMVWVGGHILLMALDQLGGDLHGTVGAVLHAPYGFVHHLETMVAEAVPGVGPVLGWLVNTLASAVVGLVVGGIVVAVMHVLPGRGDSANQH